MTFQFPDGYDDTPEIIIDRLRAELADVRARARAMELERDAARAEAARLRELIEDIEWNGNDNADQCPKCLNTRKDGHTKACNIAAALREPAQSEQPAERRQEANDGNE